MRGLILFLIGITTTLQAQLSKGDKFIGGTGAVANQFKREDPQAFLPTLDGSYFLFNPTLGFVLNEKYAIGGIVNLATRFGNGFSLNATTFGVGGLLRRYINISDHFVFALSGQIVYNRNMEKRWVYDSQIYQFVEQKVFANELSADITPMFIYFPTPAWGFEAGIGSVGLAWANNRTEKSRDYQVFAGLGQFKLGINYYIRK